MEQRQQLSLQTQVHEYFKEVDDVTFSNVVESIVYHLPNRGVNKLVEKFLKDNDIEEAYIGYVLDMKKVESERVNFNRSSMSQRDLIETLKHAFLNESFNRFRNLVIDHSKLETHHEKYKKKYVKLGKDLEKLNSAIAKIMDAGSPERFDEGMDELREHYL